jgi:hypothetical protein
MPSRGPNAGGHRWRISLEIRDDRVYEPYGLGISVSATTIATMLRASSLRPAPRRIGPSWPEFLRAQAHSLLSCDLRPATADRLRGDASGRSESAQDGQTHEVDVDDKLAHGAADKPSAHF